ncbi:ABC transporter ATP-binding protein [Telmatospirillum sp. J64-1]|uniref:ABC transporter ATP-binding protein n=1 Tax=Telmatospirillum sp. J64-1 TaxID=2502183 RepID=UPI00115DAC1A|nr:ABC transporter ATP-binding protein [Telmatospirillum sp. J64-1]
MAALLSLRDLRVAFDGVATLRGLSLDIAPGEALGMVGESGCGKSITWLAALGLLPRKARVEGSARIGGTELIGAPPALLDDIRGGRIGMIFQDPASALNPVLRIGRQLAEALRLHQGLTGEAARAEAKRLLDIVGIPDAARRLNAYPHELSGGQNQRVMIAMALAGNPDLLIADEPTTALDATIQVQILDLLGQLRRERNMALVLISHDLGLVAEHCDRVAVMYAGQIVEEAPSDDLFARPLHPYAEGLLRALPRLTGPRQPLDPIPGTVPDMRALPPGCAFGPRCPRRINACRSTQPRLREAGRGRRVNCLNDTASPAASGTSGRMTGDAA